MKRGSSTPRNRYTGFPATQRAGGVQVAGGVHTPAVPVQVGERPKKDASTRAKDGWHQVIGMGGNPTH